MTDQDFFGSGWSDPVVLNESEPYDPFETWNDLNDDQAFDWSQHFRPSGTLVSNAMEIGRAFAEQQGFDLGIVQSGEVGRGKDLEVRIICLDSSVKRVQAGGIVGNRPVPVPARWLLLSDGDSVKVRGSGIGDIGFQRRFCQRQGRSAPGRKGVP